MTRINTNVASLRGLRNTNKANASLNQSLTRLSTGVKINSGKDNPSGLIASATLGSQISAIGQSISNSNRANNVLSTADSAPGAKSAACSPRSAGWCRKASTAVPSRRTRSRRTRGKSTPP